MKTTPTDLKCSSNVQEDAQAEALFNDTLKILGDFWVLRIIGALASGPLRYCEIERTLKNSNPVTLTNRLKKLEDHHYINRMAEVTDKQSVSYQLTSSGEAVLPIVTALKQFSQNHS